MSLPGGSPVPPRPWYREPWPWIIIGLLGSVVIASGVTLWIAVMNPDALVVDDAEYQDIRSGLRARDEGAAGEQDPGVGDGAPSAEDG